ncbi:type II toxin-antitoxin system RelE/ParE family toxin [Thiohalophilus sp.]|uniref:type II toxin-antitoxin system RelE/ParE family toxin n=1 Tax=Thiohalophilus sp. TaxID=3028392 RepID=UPI002ACE1E8B|nr:type II toxin-antitoxin system RelE/ParE family toxin [Thiohalophilus sp.]MDZ7661965.1 type II toxin-antitoxin system RelE/ParE family toxin [Thiohalophilus sp.]
MRIKWLRTALSNLEQEAAYIAKDNPEAARLVVQRIEHSVALLANNPALGRAGRVPATRELLVPNTRYLIPYRVRPRLHQIEILRVFHLARRIPGQW